MMRMNGGVSSVLRDDKDRRKAYFWCAPAWLWLTLIVTFESLLMSGWVVREYYQFDYTCLLLQQNRTSMPTDHSAAFGPRIIYGSPEPIPKRRRLRYLEFNATIPNFIGDFIPDPEPFSANIYDSQGHLIQDGSAIVVDEPMILESDYQKFDDRFRRRKRSADKVETSLTTTPKPRRRIQIRRRKKQPTPLTTLQSVVLVEQLPISGESGEGGTQVLKIKTTKIKSFPQNSTLIKRRRKKRPKTKPTSSEANQVPKGMMGYSSNQYYSTEEEEDRPRLKKLANEETEIMGTRQLRGYRGKGGRNRGKATKPKDSKPTMATIVTPAPILATTVTPAATGLPPTPLPSNATSIAMSEVLVKAVASSINNDKDDKDDETTTTSTTATVAFSGGTSGTIAPSPTFPGYSQDFKGDEVGVDSSHQARALPEMPKFHPNQPREHNFQVQIQTFSALALCIARTLFDFWCLAQVIASIPFLFGVCLRIRCLFIARLMLDALFLVILFIYTITIISFSIILYILVDEMTSEVVIEWLIFGILLLFFMAIYIATFTLTLRCCELVLNEKVKPYKEKRSKSLLYTEIASDHMLEVADEV